MEHVYIQRKEKNSNMSDVHDFALGLNSWNVSAEIFKFVDQENSNENESPTPNPNAGESFLRAFYFV